MRTTPKRLRAHILFLLLMALPPATICQQKPDPAFNPAVTKPAYKLRRPKVLFDEAHFNSHTTRHTYKPFVDLITLDGYRVIPNKSKFSKLSLRGYDILVVVNAAGQPQKESSAFTEEECDAVRDWVNAGGSLLLVAGHRPYGGAAAQLAKRFGVDITPGHAMEKQNYNKDTADESEIVFSRENKMLADHAITEGRGDAERISRVMTFSGTTIKGPEKSTTFLKLGATAFDVLPPDPEPNPDPLKPPDHKVIPADGRGQAVAFEFGKGRVVVLADPNALTAQMTNKGERFGMNVSGIDNQQLALNIMHWLSRLLK